MAPEDFYSTLGIERSASADEIKRAYRKLALKHHPDRNPGNKAAEEEFKKISHAYEILSDSTKKQSYDQFGHAGVQGASGAGAGGFSGGFGGVEDLFGDIFGDFLGGRSRSRGSRASRGIAGDDLRYEFRVSFHDSAFGKKTRVEIQKEEQCGTCKGSGAKPGTHPTTCQQCQGAGEVRFQQGFFSVSRTCNRCGGEGKMIGTPCGACHGRGTSRKKKMIDVTIPAGIASGQSLRLSGEGNSGTKGGPSGDLYLVIDVEDHPVFTRERNDVLCEVPISFEQAALGAEVHAPTLKGKVQMKIPAGTQWGKVFRLKGKGFPDISGYGQGDQLVRIMVETPTKLSKEQKELLKRFSELSGNKTQPLQSSFFDKMKDLFG